MRFQGIKVTLVTGFLGAGKTTLIRQLLTQSPPNERWAVLVNEFGDIGLDSAFYADLDVAITEVPGGCVCCTTSAAFQQGLNQLIRQYNPDRIFIEPSGLGHPKQIIQKLRGDAYQDVLLLTGAFCVLDARNLNDERYTKHAIFNDQIESADGIVLSHVNRYQQDDIDLVKARFGSFSIPTRKPTLFFSDPMTLDIDSLDIGLKDMPFLSNIPKEEEHQTPEQHTHALHHTQQKAPLDDDTRYYQKQQDAMQVLGWRWSRDHCFDEEKVNSIVHFIASLDGVYRIKGVFVVSSTKAVFVNVARGEISMNTSVWHEASRMEVIGGIEGNWPNALRQRCDDILS